MWTKIKLALGAVAVAALGLWYALRSARQDGIKINEAEQAEKRDELRSQFDKIDGERPDRGAAYGRLRSRAEDGGR